MAPALPKIVMAEEEFFKWLEIPEDISGVMDVLPIIQSMIMRTD